MSDLLAREDDPLSSPFEPMLRGRQLARVFFTMFMLPADASEEVFLDGFMDKIWSVRWIKPFLRLLARWDTLFPEDAIAVPTVLHIFVGRDSMNRLCHHWNRTFLLPRRHRRFNAYLVWEPRRRWVAERTGPGGCLEAGWHVKVVPPNNLKIDGTVKAIHIGKARIPIPRFLQLDAHVVDTAHIDRDDLLHCDLSMSNPLVGRLFGYQGTFLVRRVPSQESAQAA
jgi:hypothetical protein